MASIMKRRRTIFRSLTSRYVLVSLIILSILSVFVYASVDFTRHMAGEAATINASGQLRFRSYQMAWHAQRLAEKAYPPDEKTQSREELSRLLRDYDKLLEDIATGSVGLNTKPIAHYSTIVAIFNRIRQHWEHGLKPPLTKIAALPLDTPEAQMRALLVDYDERLPGFVDDVNDLVKALELHYDKEIQHFVQQRLLIVAIFTAAALFIAWYIRRNIVAPMKLLTRSARRLQDGEFDVQTPIRSGDEIGTLGAVFNGMALGLKELFDEKSRRLREFDALSTISRAASEILAVDVMAGRILDAILGLEPLALAKKGAIFISDRDKKTLELVVARNYSAEQVSGCGIVQYGECLCGIAAERNETILSDNNAHDSRHTRAYSGTPEHGHIILPLNARHKLIGVVCLYLPPGMPPSAEDLRLYQSMAEIIAVALQNAINHRQVAMLAQSLDSSNDMIIITSTEGRIIHVNPEVLRETGYSLTELIGQPVSVMQSAHNPPGPVEEIIKTTLAAGGWRGEVVSSRKDGSEFPTMLTTSLVRAEDGRILALVGIGRNIAGAKQADAALRASEEKYRTLIEEINDGLFVMDARGTFTFVNSALARIHGYEKPDDLVGKSFVELTAPESREALGRDFVRNMESGRDPGVIEIPIEKPDKSRAYIQVHPANIVEAGRIVGTRGIVRDVTERKRSEDVLHKYEYIVSASSDHLSFIDKDFVYQAVNSKYLEAFGQSRAEIIGRRVSELLGAEIFEKSLRPNLQRCLTGETVRYQAWFDFPSTGQRFMDVIYSPYRETNGEVVGIVVSSRDITDQKQSEEALRRHGEELLALAEASNVILAAATPASPGANELYKTICDIAVAKFGLRMAWLGLVREGDKVVRPAAWAGFEDGFLSHIRVTWDDSPDGMGPIGMAIKTRVPVAVGNVEEDPRCAPRRAEALRRGYRSSMAVPLITTGGRLLGTLNMYSEERDHFTRQRVELLQVYTNQAATVIENAQLIGGLEEKVRVRTMELESARSYAEDANRAKTDFLANMSHELRTPLNSILGFSEIMRDGLAGEVNPQQKEYLNDVWESGSHLLRLINDILDISKIEAGKMELERGVVDLNPLLGEALVFFREKAARNTIRLHREVAEDLPTISADGRKIKQVLINLLTNALKFTPDGGEVGVKASVEAGELRVTVWDTGIGIAPEDLGRLFQPFQQLESPLTKKHEGTGLGLSLCSKIVELHGGRIWVESTPGTGSRFTFAIPVVAAAENAAQG